MKPTKKTKRDDEVPENPPDWTQLRLEGVERSVNTLINDQYKNRQLRHQIRYLIYGVGILCLLALYLWKE